MALFDPFRRAMGIPTETELRDARLVRLRIEQSHEPRDVFAAAVANALHDRPEPQALRNFHELRRTKVEWPSSPELRWSQAAKVARQFAEHHLKNPIGGLDASLAEAVNIRVLTDTAQDLHKLKPDGDINYILSQKTEQTAMNVHALMSYGKVAESNAHEQARALSYNPDPVIHRKLREDVAEFMPGPSPDNRRTWLIEASRTRIAMAQTGLLSPERTVDAAMEAATLGPQRMGARAIVNRHLGLAATGPQRAEMVSAMKQRTMAATYGSHSPNGVNTNIERPRYEGRDNNITTQDVIDKIDRPLRHELQLRVHAAEAVAARAASVNH